MKQQSSCRRTLFGPSTFGRKLALCALSLVVLVGIACGSLSMYRSNQARISEANRLADQRMESDRASIKRSKLKAEQKLQDADDWERFGASCSRACDPSGIDPRSCAVGCSRSQGDAIRSKRQMYAMRACLTECGDPSGAACIVLCDSKHPRASQRVEGD